VPRRPSTRQPPSLAILERVQHLEDVIENMQRRLDIAIEPPLTVHGSSTRTPTNDEIESVTRSDSIECADEISNLETEFGRLAMGNGRRRYMIGNYWAVWTRR
jgi:hypothetical protein